METDRHPAASAAQPLSQDQVQPSDRPRAPIDVSVIVINWNTAAYLRRCLDSLAGDGLSGMNAEVWVIDNASHDGSAEMVAQRYPWVRLQANADNLGFAAANNAIMRVATGEFFFLVNADMEIPPGAIQTLLSRTRSRADVGIAACRQLDGQGRELESSMPSYPPDLLPYEPPLPDHRPRQGPETEAAWVWASGMLARRTVFEQVGGFDETFFMYYEDMEWCWRARRAGWRIVCHPDVHVVHFVRRSTAMAPTAETARRLVSGELALRERHMSPRRLRHFLTARLLYALRGVIFYRCLLAIAPGERFRMKYFRYLEYVRAILPRSRALRALAASFHRALRRAGWSPDIHEPEPRPPGAEEH